MSKDLVIAILGFVTAIIGLVATLLGRKKVHEVHINSGNSTEHRPAIDAVLDSERLDRARTSQGSPQRRSPVDFPSPTAFAGTGLVIGGVVVGAIGVLIGSGAVPSWVLYGGGAIAGIICGFLAGGYLLGGLTGEEAGAIAGWILGAIGGGVFGIVIANSLAALAGVGGRGMEGGMIGAGLGIVAGGCVCFAT